MTHCSVVLVLRERKGNEVPQWLHLKAIYLRSLKQKIMREKKIINRLNCYWWWAAYACTMSYSICCHRSEKIEKLISINWMEVRERRWNNKRHVSFVSLWQRDGMTEETLQIGIWCDNNWQYFFLSQSTRDFFLREMIDNVI